MKILVDMNLSPLWGKTLRARGWETVHWSAVGDPQAQDKEILDYARSHGFIVFTHDLDFGSLLALTRATGPSVIQVRTQDVMPVRLEEIVASVLERHRDVLAAGALVVIDETTARVRILPLGQ